MNPPNNYKVCLIGPPQVGKTRVVYKCMGNPITQHHQYTPSLVVEVHPYMFRRNGRDICVNIWDMAGDPRFLGLGGGYLIKAKLCVIYCPTHLQPTHLSYWTYMATQHGVNYVVATDDNEVVRALQHNNFV